MREQNIPRLVKDLRKAMGLTQEQFAQELGGRFESVNEVGITSTLVYRRIPLLKMREHGRNQELSLVR